MDDPRGCAGGIVARGHVGGGLRAAEGDEGIEGVAQIEPSIGVSHSRPDRPRTSTSCVRRCRSRSARSRRRRSSPRCGAASRRTPATAPHHARATRWAAARAPAASPSRRTSSGPTSTRSLEYSKQALDEAQKRAQPDRGQDRPQRLEPGSARRRRPQAGRRPRRPHGDHRQHAAPGGVRRRRDLLLQGRPGAVSGQDPRAREPAPRHRPDRPADGAVRHRAGPHRQHRPARARPRPDHAAALEPAVHRHADRRRRARPRARRGVERRPADAGRAQHAARRCRSGCRGSRRSSTRRPPT